MDDQHRRLFELADFVVNDDFAHFGHAWYEGAINTFFDYTHYHFAAEEHLMRKLAYPDFETHRNWHDQFRLELSEVIDATRRSSDIAQARVRVKKMLETLLSEHLHVTDKQLADYALQHESKENLRLADSATLRKAGVFVAEIEQEEFATGTDAAESRVFI
jgi:hemerythrin